MQGYRWLRFVPLLLPGVVSLAACDRPDFQLSDTAPVVGTGGTPSSFPTAGSTPVEACALDSSQGGMPIFWDQTVVNTAIARREVYAYVSDAEAKELRDSGTLFPPLAPNTPTPTPPVLSQLNTRLGSASAEQKPMIEALQQRFKRVRSSWPNLWALRLVNHAASEHMNPVRIVFRQDAWFGRISDKSVPVIVDMKNQIVSPANVALEPDRVGAIFVVLSPQTTGVSSCDQGLRDFSIPHERMIESWSLGTPEIVDRLDADVQLLTELFGVVRSCGSVDKGGMTFHANIVCSTWSSFGVASEYAAYGWALANPAELYKPSGQNLLGLVDALKNDRFEPEPFVVMPERVVASGGTGGAGGGGAGGAAGSGGGGAGGLDAGAGGAP